MRFASIAFALLLVISLAHCLPSRSIQLRAKIVDPAATVSLLHESVKRDALPLYTETGLYLVQASHRVTPHFRSAIADVLDRSAILRYIPSDTLLVRATLAELEALKEIPEVCSPSCKHLIALHLSDVRS